MDERMGGFFSYILKTMRSEGFDVSNIRTDRKNNNDILEAYIGGLPTKTVQKYVDPENDIGSVHLFAIKSVKNYLSEIFIFHPAPLTEESIFRKDKPCSKEENEYLTDFFKFLKQEKPKLYEGIKEKYSSFSEAVENLIDSNRYFKEYEKMKEKQISQKRSFFSRNPSLSEKEKLDIIKDLDKKFNSVIKAFTFYCYENVEEMIKLIHNKFAVGKNLKAETNMEIIGSEETPFSAKVDHGVISKYEFRTLLPDYLDDRRSEAYNIIYKQPNYNLLLKIYGDLPESCVDDPFVKLISGHESQISLSMPIEEHLMDVNIINPSSDPIYRFVIDDKMKKLSYVASKDRLNDMIDILMI